MFFFYVFFHANDNEQQRKRRFIVRAYRVNDELLNEQQLQLRLSRHKHLQRRSSGMNDISIYQHTNVSYCLFHRMNRCISSVELLPFSSPFYVMMHRNCQNKRECSIRDSEDRFTVCHICQQYRLFSFV